jgi:hypothetical protein
VYLQRESECVCGGGGGKRERREAQEANAAHRDTNTKKVLDREAQGANASTLNASTLNASTLNAALGDTEKGLDRETERQIDTHIGTERYGR